MMDYSDHTVKLYNKCICNNVNFHFKPCFLIEASQDSQTTYKFHRKWTLHVNYKDTDQPTLNFTILEL